MGRPQEYSLMALESTSVHTPTPRYELLGGHFGSFSWGFLRLLLDAAAYFLRLPAASFLSSAAYCFLPAAAFLLLPSSCCLLHSCGCMLPSCWVLLPAACRLLPAYN